MSSFLHIRIKRAFSWVFVISMIQCVHGQGNMPGVMPSPPGTTPADTSGVVTVVMPENESIKSGDESEPPKPGNPLSPTSNRPVVVAQDVKYFFKQLVSCDTLGQNTYYFDLSTVGGPRMWIQADSKGFCRLAIQAAGSRLASICHISKDDLKTYFPEDSLKKIMSFDLVKNDLKTIVSQFEPLVNCAGGVPNGVPPGEANIPGSTSPAQSSGSQDTYDYGKLLQ